MIGVATTRGTRGRGRSRGPRDLRDPLSRGPEAGPGVRPLPKGKKKLHFVEIVLYHVIDWVAGITQYLIVSFQKNLICKNLFDQ